MKGGLLNSGSKTQQTDTCVAAVYLATRIPHNSMNAILHALVPLRRQCLEKVLCYLSHKPETEFRKGFTSFVSLHWRVCCLFPSFLNYCYWVEIFPLVSHTPNIFLLLRQMFEMVLSNLYYYIYYYALHNWEFMFFILSLFNYSGTGVEISPLLSHETMNIQNIRKRRTTCLWFRLRMNVDFIWKEWWICRFQGT